MKRIDDITFRSTKRDLRIHRVSTVAKRQKLSLKTVLQIRGSKTFEEYQQNNKAQHPPVKESLRDEVLYLHYITFSVPGEGYIPPLTARKAIKELQEKAHRGNR